MLDDHTLLTVTDIKQFDYCARVIFFEQCLPHIRPRTYKMDVGRDEHENERKRAARRTLTGYGEIDGQRQFDVKLASASLGLTGEVDEVVITTTGAVFPVDYKLAKHARRNYKLQLTAYALLLEDAEGVTISHGYLYLIPVRKLVKVTITPKLRAAVIMCVEDAHAMLAEEQMPPPTSVRTRCPACEFRRFCNDV